MNEQVMKDRNFVFTYRTRIGTFRIQAHKEKFGLFIDYPQGDFDLLTLCVSVDDGIDYIEHQDTVISDWDSMPTEQVPDAIRNVENWERQPLRQKK